MSLDFGFGVLVGAVVGWYTPKAAVQFKALVQRLKAWWAARNAPPEA